MAKYTCTVSSSLCNTAEEAVTALDTLITAADVTRLNMKYDIIRIEANKYLAWLCYTDEA
jgi:hypothetical protein